MRFELLGPLEVVDDGRPVVLGGSKQRATLGFLLLHLNSVVATSGLLKALWPDDMPATGRKMLQNAVSGLRDVLATSGGPDAPILLTHAPGYLLRADPESVDLSRFHRLAQAGRTDLAAGQWRQAARTLREALALWRGPVLADLVEQGVGWPELAAVQNARLTALEDCVEAEFASGRYSQVIGELEYWVDAEPLRERLCGQLMRALYHCGRQADALTVFRRTRTRLHDDHGLDPSLELQDLERAILTQDLPVAEAAVAAEPVRVATLHDVTREHPPEPVAATPSQEPDALPLFAELKRISVVFVLTRFERDVTDAAPEIVDKVVRLADDRIRSLVEEHGGVLDGSVASLRMAVFGAVRSDADDTVRAVRAAVAIRDWFARQTPEVLRDPAALTATVAVASGDALVRRHGIAAADPPEVTGGVLDRGMRLLAHVSPGEARVCHETRTASEPAVVYDGESDPVRGSRAVVGREHPLQPLPAAPFVHRDPELTMLVRVLDQVCHRSKPFLVTVLGESGMGKSRLIAEFQRAAVDTARVLVGRSPQFGRPGVLAALAEGLRPYFGVSESDTGELVGNHIATAVHRVAGTGDRADWMLSRLEALFDVDDAEPPADSFDAWRQFLEGASQVEPLVLVVEDLHWADDRTLDFVDQLTAETTAFPLLVVVTARPELLDRRPSWGGGKAGSSTITLDPLSDDDSTWLLAALCAGTGTTDTYRAVAEHIGGNPLFAVEYARMLCDARRRPGAELPLPPMVRRVVAAMIDSLPPAAKAVLLDAAVLGENLCEAGVTAVGGGAVPDVSHVLGYLERREMLRRAKGADTHADFTFRSPLVREVAHLTIPESVRADKHRRAAEWLESLPRKHVQSLRYHYSEANNTGSGFPRHDPPRRDCGGPRTGRTHVGEPTPAPGDRAVGGRWSRTLGGLGVRG